MIQTLDLLSEAVVLMDEQRIKDGGVRNQAPLLYKTSNRCKIAQIFLRDCSH